MSLRQLASFGKRAMLSGIILVVFLLCYCCHKSGRKAESNSPYSGTHRDPGMSLEVYTIEPQNCYIPEDVPMYEIHRMPTTAPPPPYQEAVLVKKSSDDSGLPSYEAAMKLGNCYV